VTLTAEPARQLTSYQLSHLDALEAEAIFIMREVAAELERPVLLFSGGKDSIVLLRLAEKAFRPARFPFPVMHIDTGHNFPEVLEFRDRRMAELGERLIVASVQESIDRGRVVEESGPRASRNRLQTTTLLDTIEAYGFDAAVGGARRDEEKARAKERILSFRDEFGQWDPKNQRPELWSLYNGRIRRGEHVRVFPLSNWSELDVWQYVLLERIPVVPLYFAAERPVVEREGNLIVVDDDRFRDLFLDIMPSKPGEWPRMDRSFVDAEGMTHGGFSEKFFARLGVSDGAGVPPGDERVGLPLLLKGEPHDDRRLGFAADRGEGLVAHPHDVGRLDDVEPLAVHVGVAAQRRFDVRRAPDELDAKARWQLAQGLRHPLDFHLRRVIPAHRVERDADHLRRPRPR